MTAARLADSPASLAPLSSEKSQIKNPATEEGIAVSLPSPDTHESEIERGLLETILEGTASDTGEEFLAALVRSLARALRVDGA